MQDSEKQILDLIIYREEEQFSLLAKLQAILKEEYFLLTTQSQQKETFQKKMHSTLFSYYRSTVHLGQILLPQDRSKADKSYSSFSSDRSDKSEKIVKFQDQKRLLADEGFGDAYVFVKETVLYLSKDPYLMSILIRKYQSSLSAESMSSLANVIVSSMYENIADDDVYHKDLLKIITFCIKQLIQRKQHPFEISLLEKGFVQTILAQLTERSDAKQYSKRVIRNTLLEIAKIDHTLQFKPKPEEPKSSIKASMKLERQDSNKYSQGVPRTNNYQLSTGEKQSKIRHYTESLRTYDQKNKKGLSVKRKYRNCISSQLLNELGIYQETVFPCFSSKKSKNAREQVNISKKLGKMLHKSESKIEALAHCDVHTVKNIILIFFNDLFKMLYSMPLILRISSRIFYKYLINRFSQKQSLGLVADYIINFWLVSALKVDTVVAEVNRPSPNLQGNAQLIITLIKSISRDKLKDLDQFFLQQYSQLAANIKQSIINYIQQVINIDTSNIDPLCRQVDSYYDLKSPQKKPQPSNIKSYCVCISMADIKCLIKMIKDAEKQLIDINDKIVKRVQRIELMTKDNDIFGDKRDKQTGKYYRSNKAYALFTELSLPSQLSVDYFQIYKTAFKFNKIKNLLRQILLSMNEVTIFSEFHTSNQLEDFFDFISLSTQTVLYSIDNIPLKLKLDYLSVLSKNVKLKSIASELYDETQKRIDLFNTIWTNTKDCYLRAITSIDFQINKLSMREDLIRDQAKRRKLQEFFSKNQIRLCLTSPKTREKQLIFKTNLMKDVSEEYKEKLWLQNQSKCIHSALNLEFIKSLTGQPQKSHTRYESHINSITRFSEILCSLPEVKQRFTMAEDSIGVKQVFFEFVKYIRDFIKAKEADFSIIIQDLQWLEENIQLKISKRLYDKLNPRVPLYDDIALHLRLKTMQWVTFSHLGINQFLWKDELWQVAASHLRLIDKLGTAAEKLHCVETTSKIIFNSYKLMTREERTVSAEDIYPLVIYVLIRAAPKRLISSINFIQCFASRSKLLSQQGYCFTQLKAAILFCDSLSSSGINIFPNPSANHIEFNRRIYDQEVKSGIYFMLGRGKDSLESEKLKQERLKQYFKEKEEVSIN